MSAIKTATTSERILAAATELFYEKGYHGTTMREIAAAVEIKAGSLYNHFDGKQELLTRISISTTQALYDGAVARLDGIESAEERLKAFVKWHVEFHARERHAARVTDEQLHALTARNRKLLLELRDAHEQLFGGILSEGAKSHGWKVEDPSVIAIALLTMCTQVDVWYRENGRLSPEQIGELFASFILSGLEGRQPTTDASENGRPEP
jgi:AcrR family transcriptional regulator